MAAVVAVTLHVWPQLGKWYLGGGEGEAED